MIHVAVDRSKSKGLQLGPGTPRPDSIGYADRGIDEKHFYRKKLEIHLIASGTLKPGLARMRVP